jgi:hypothetical protein
MTQDRPATCLDTFALRHVITGHVLEKATWCDEALMWRPATCLDTFALRHDIRGYVLEKATWRDEAVIVEEDLRIITLE